MKNIILLILFINAGNLMAQNHICYNYDNGGNRTIKYFGGTDCSPPPIAEPDISELKGTLYPNPVEDRLTMKFDSKTLESDRIEYEMFDIMGKRVLADRLNGHIGQIDVSNLPPGMYIFVARADGQQKEWKIIKE